MIRLDDEKLSFILINPFTDSISQYENSVKEQRLTSVLYSKDYTLYPIKEYYEGKYTECLLGISSAVSNDEIRNETLQILDFMDIDDAIIKYLDETKPVKINKVGQEKLLSFSIVENNSESKVYITDGSQFSFKEEKRFFYPSKKEQLKEGMTLEYFNNNMWNTKEIKNLDTEFEKMYKLLMKYNKIRIATI